MPVGEELLHINGKVYIQEKGEKLKSEWLNFIYGGEGTVVEVNVNKIKSRKKSESVKCGKKERMIDTTINCMVG